VRPRDGFLRGGSGNSGGFCETLQRHIAEGILGIFGGLLEGTRPPSACFPCAESVKLDIVTLRPEILGASRWSRTTGFLGVGDWGLCAIHAPPSINPPAIATPSQCAALVLPVSPRRASLLASHTQPGREKRSFVILPVVSTRLWSVFLESAPLKGALWEGGKDDNGSRQSFN
jgi:hypothetical protein